MHILKTILNFRSSRLNYKYFNETNFASSRIGVDNLTIFTIIFSIFLWISLLDIIPRNAYLQDREIVSILEDKYAKYMTVGMLSSTSKPVDSNICTKSTSTNNGDDKTKKNWLDCCIHTWFAVQINQVWEPRFSVQYMATDNSCWLCVG